MSVPVNRFPPIVYPMVAQGKARIRTIMNAALSKEDLDFAISAFEVAGRELDVISRIAP